MHTIKDRNRSKRFNYFDNTFSFLKKIKDCEVMPEKNERKSILDIDWI